MAKTRTFKTEAGDVKLTAKGIAALDALCKTGGDVKLAATAAKLSTKQVGRIKAIPAVKAIMIQRARDTIIQHAPKAADKLASLMDSPSQKVQFESARRILDVANIRPPDAPVPQVNIGIGVFPSRAVINPDTPPEEAKAIRAEWANYRGPGYLIDLSGDRDATEAETVPANG